MDSAASRRGRFALRAAVLTPPDPTGPFAALWVGRGRAIVCIFCRNYVQEFAHVPSRSFSLATDSKPNQALLGRVESGWIWSFSCISLGINKTEMLAFASQSGPITQLPMAEFIFGSTPGMLEARASFEAAINSDLPVLIQGESGTGKEIVARYLHLCSSRAGGPFVRVNCGALPGGLLDGEIFGRYKHEAEGAELGSMGLAADGTLLLDEFACLDLALQERVLEKLRAGVAGPDEEQNARVLCSTSVDVEVAVSEKRIPEGLADALVHRIRLLPLRERKRDLPQLCDYLIEKFAVSFGRPVPRLEADVLEMFEKWNWPGNIRELENWIARIVIFGAEEAMGPEFKNQASRRSIGTRRHGIGMNLTRFRRARRQS